MWVQIKQVNDEVCVRRIDLRILSISDPPTRKAEKAAYLTGVTRRGVSTIYSSRDGRC